MLVDLKAFTNSDCLRVKNALCINRSTIMIFVKMKRERPKLR